MQAPAGRSPFDLIQEQLERGPLYGWRVLVACLLLNRARGPVARRCLVELLERWPDPVALMGADHPEVVDVVRPCGFGATKARRVVAMSRAWFAHFGWRSLDGEQLNPPEEELRAFDPLAVHGIGPYARDSWCVFVLRELPDVEPRDGKIAAYWRWARSTNPDDAVRHPHRHLVRRLSVGEALDAHLQDRPAPRGDPELHREAAAARLRDERGAPVSCPLVKAKAIVAAILHLIDVATVQGVDLADTRSAIEGSPTLETSERWADKRQARDPIKKVEKVKKTGEARRKRRKRAKEEECKRNESPSTS